MRNTGIEYTSAERTPTILPDLAELLPPLSGEQLAALEKDILQNGCYAPIIVNEDLVVVDGHNRQQICTRHDLPYKMAVFAFDDLLEAKQWALDTQKGRRNLDKWELGKIALKLRPEIEARAKANQGARTDLSATLPEGDVYKRQLVCCMRMPSITTACSSATVGTARRPSPVCGAPTTGTAAVSRATPPAATNPSVSDCRMPRTEMCIRDRVCTGTLVGLCPGLDLRPQFQGDLAQLPFVQVAAALLGIDVYKRQALYSN